MKEYEIVARFYNACAGAGRPQTFFEEAELNDPYEYVRMKHGDKASQFVRETNPAGQIVYKWDNGSVCYVYEFTEV